MISSMITLLTNVSFATVGAVIAGISWEPEIRGALTVVLASAVLMGSVWLILVTNTGVRLGSLIALAGFFGWMMLMGIFWWIYGIGYAGDLPSWEVKEFNSDPAGYEIEGLTDSVLGNVGLLPDNNCEPGAISFPPAVESDIPALNVAPNCLPRAVELLWAYPGDDREVVFQELLNPQLDENKIPYLAGVAGVSSGNAMFNSLLAGSESEIRAGVETKNATLVEGDSRFLDAAGVDDEVASLVDRRNRRINQLTLSQLAAIGPQVIDWGLEEGHIDLRGWNLLSTAQSGEAVATAQGAVNDEGVFDGHEFIVLDSFQQGGKPLRTNDSTLGRIWHKITSTARITHPTNYAIVQTQIALDQEAQAGELPPLPQVDDEGSVVSVIMTRNLGNLRLVPALVTLASGLLFLASCLALHLRDLELERRLAGAPA